MVKNVLDPNYGIHPSQKDIYGLYLNTHDGFIQIHACEFEQLCRQYPYLTVEDLKLPYVYAYKIHRTGRFAAWLTLDDLVGYALLAFTSALVTYDPTAGMKLSSWFTRKFRDEHAELRRIAERNENDAGERDLSLDELVERWIEHGDGAVLRGVVIRDHVQEAQDMLELVEGVVQGIQAITHDEIRIDRVKKLLYLQYAGLTEKKIAEKLHVDLSTVRRDMRWLKTILQERYDAKYGRKG